MFNSSELAWKVESYECHAPNVRFGSTPAILKSDWDITLDGLVLPEEIGKAESGLSADQDFGDLEGVEGGAFAEVVGHDPRVTIHRWTLFCAQLPARYCLKIKKSKLRLTPFIPQCNRPSDFFSKGRKRDLSL